MTTRGRGIRRKVVYTERGERRVTKEFQLIAIVYLKGAVSYTVSDPEDGLVRHSIPCGPSPREQLTALRESVDQLWQEYVERAKMPAVEIINGASSQEILQTHESGDC